MFGCLRDLLHLAFNSAIHRLPRISAIQDAQCSEVLFILARIRTLVGPACICQHPPVSLLVIMQFIFCPLFAYFIFPALALAFPSKAGVSKGIEPHLSGKRSFYERDGVKRTVFEHDATGAKIDFVTNSGICETTPGVNQYSGYLSVGSRLYRTL